MNKIVSAVSRSQIPVFLMVLSKQKKNSSVEQQFQAKNDVRQQNFPIYLWVRKQLTDFFFISITFWTPNSKSLIG
jgi:hypothetical protein